jgi:hypothetical protein
VQGGPPSPPNKWVDCCNALARIPLFSYKCSMGAELTHFGPFTLDRGAAALLSGGKPIVIGQRAYALSGPGRQPAQVVNRVGRQHEVHSIRHDWWFKPGQL